MLKAHLNTHVEKKRTFTCEICGKSFVKKAQLHDHIATNHKDSSERIAKIAKQCPICHEWLLSKSSIYYHKKLHEDLPVICEHCQKELPNRRSYLHHIKKYHTVHKFKCSFCEKTYPVASKLKVINSRSIVILKEKKNKFVGSFFRFMKSHIQGTDRIHANIVLVIILKCLRCTIR